MALYKIEERMGDMKVTSSYLTYVVTAMLLCMMP